MYIHVCNMYVCVRVCLCMYVVFVAVKSIFRLLNTKNELKDICINGIVMDFRVCICYP